MSNENNKAFEDSVAIIQKTRELVEEAKRYMVSLRLAIKSSVEQEDKSLVLVIDDDPDILVSMTNMLEIKNFDAIGVDGGVAAIEWLKTHNPGIILLDLMMPDMDGWELLWVLRTNPDTANIPVIIISAMQTDTRIEGIAFMQKPVSVEHLLQIMKDEYGCVGRTGAGFDPKIVR